MKSTPKILLILCLSAIYLPAFAQDESPLQPFFNRVMLNPAFAGLDKQTTFQTGNQFSQYDSISSYNLFYASYDTYSDKLKGGIAFFFQQGLIGSKNISTTELGFAYSGSPRKITNGTIRFAANTNFLLATKQWMLTILDKLAINELNNSNPPGSEFFRYIMLKPRLSLLMEVSSVTWGLSVGSGWKMDINTSDSDEKKAFPLNGSFYLAKNREGFHKGLHSRPFVINPELLIYYEPDYIFCRLNLYAELTNRSFGAFLQGDFSHQNYGAGGIIGFASDNLRLNLSAGAGVNGSTKKLGLTAELSLILRVSQIDYSKINPWEPQ